MTEITYLTGPGGTRAEIADRVRDNRVAALFSDGSTVVPQALHRTWPAVIDFCTALAEDLGHPVQANACVTPSQSQGFSARYNDHDVFVLQIAGRKHWRVHEPVLTRPRRTQLWTQHGDAVAARARADEPVTDPVLEPGDVMHLPRGWLHSGTALGSSSAHLTIGGHVATRYALAESILQILTSDELLLAPMPLRIDVADPEQLAPHVDAVRYALVVALRGGTPAAVARCVRGWVWTGGRPEFVGPVAFARDLAPATPCVAVSTCTTVSCRMMIRWCWAGREHANAVRRCRTCPAGRARLRDYALGERPGLDAKDQVVVVCRQLREGSLVPAQQWFLVEHGGAWPRLVLQSLDPEAATALREWAASTGARIVLIRRPGRRGRDTDRLRWLRVDARPERESVRTGTWAPSPSPSPRWRAPRRLPRRARPPARRRRPHGT